MSETNQDESGATAARPLRELWPLVDVAEASATFEVATRAIAGRGEVATDA